MGKFVVRTSGKVFEGTCDNPDCEYQGQVFFFRVGFNILNKKCPYCKVNLKKIEK